VMRRLALLCMGCLGCFESPEAPPPPDGMMPPQPPSADLAASQDLSPPWDPAAYLQIIDETHRFLVNNLLAPSHSYRVSTANLTSTFTWYDVSQISGDAAMVGLGDSRFLPYMNQAYAPFMDHLWDHGVAVGGYFAVAAIDGSSPDRSVKYVDDNSLAGVA